MREWRRHNEARVLISGIGGETPINNSIVLYEKLKEKHPEFIEEVEKKVRIMQLRQKPPLARRGEI